MEPSTYIFEAIMYPAAIYAESVPLFERALANPQAASWLQSPLNPKNRLSGTDADLSLSWRVDGGEADGTRFFTIPHLALRKPPLRVDTWIPDQHNHSPCLREALQSTRAMSVSSRRVPDLAISQYVVRALHFWSMSQPNFSQQYMSLPFGSRIVISRMSHDVQEMDIDLIPNYKVEQEWLSVQTLQDMWHLPESHWPDLLDCEDLQMEGQLYEAISLVSISGKGDSKFIFKALVNDIKHMYHEIKLLLTIPPHPNIISRPLHIVTKKCRFGGKVGVCGFIHSYHPHGTLQTILHRSHEDSSVVTLSTRLRWARQVTNALIHIHSSPVGFYTNLKLTNLLMSSSSPSSAAGSPSDPNGLSVLLIDFEQHPGWYSWSPPEIAYIEYLDSLVGSPIPPPKVKAYYSTLLRSLNPDYRSRSSINHYQASDAPQTYSAGWQALSSSEQESAQVYLLGMILWCIFEGCASINNMITVETFREEETRKSFPEFEHTPPILRDLIRRCTAGAREWKGLRQPLVRVGNKIFPVGRTGRDGEEVGTWEETQEVARAWWKQEVESAERFVEARKRQKGAKKSSLKGREDVLAFMIQRPSLEKILKVLEQAGES
ncbi:MAG: hypothetical protein MMC33_001300 [Icmadophila ericetorum]|nr:hypothetical protein [Icmadophila ericetorum]